MNRLDERLRGFCLSPCGRDGLLYAALSAVLFFVLLWRTSLLPAGMGARLAEAALFTLPLAALAVHHTYDDRRYVEGWLDDEEFWKPVVRGLYVDYVGQKPGLPDFAVGLGEDGFPNLITASVDMEEVRYTEVNLGLFQAGDGPSVLPDLIRPEDIGSFSAWTNIVATGELKN